MVESVKNHQLNKSKNLWTPKLKVLGGPITPKNEGKLWVFIISKQISIIQYNSYTWKDFEVISLLNHKVTSAEVVIVVANNLGHLSSGPTWQ